MTPPNSTTPAAEEDRFLVSDPALIEGALRGLVHSGATIGVSFHGGSDVLITLLLDVDVATRTMTIDVNANEAANERLLAAPRMIFSALQDGVTVRWSGDSIERVVFDGRPAFRIPLPDRIRRLQRRGYFRIAIPRTQAAWCHLNLGDGHQLDVPIIDISAEGLGVLLPTPPDARIDRGVRFDDCSIELPGRDSLSLNLLVQSVWQIEARTGHKSTHAGLAFVAPPPRTRNVIEHFVTELDRKRIATRPKH